MTTTTIARAKNRRMNVRLLDNCVGRCRLRLLPPIAHHRPMPDPAWRMATSFKSRDRTTASQATTQATPAAPMTRNGSRQPPVDVGREIQHDDRSGDRTQRRSTLDDAVAERPVTARKQPLGCDQSTRPLAGLEETEQHSADEQLAIGCDPACRITDERPAQKHRRIEPSRADPVCGESRDDASDGESDSKAFLDAGVVFVAQVELAADLGRLLRERQSIHVVEHRRQQHQDADGPSSWRCSLFQGRASFFRSRPFHPSQERPSHRITRSRKVTTSWENTRKSVCALGGSGLAWITDVAGCASILGDPTL